MKHLLLGLLLLLVSGSSAAAFDFDRTPGRLPKTIVPLDYTIAIVPHAAAKTFSGRESVALIVRRPTDRIVFNTLNLRVYDVRVDGRLVPRVLIQNDKQTTTLYLQRSLPAGRHTLSMGYMGKIETAPQGLFVQPYRMKSGTSFMLSTMLESTDARRVFPCWDEPAFRSTFALTATIPAAWSAVANMPIAKRVLQGANAIVSFERTPKMPTYLVEFSAGNLAHISARHDGIVHSVWALPGQIENARYALANSQAILDDYNRYFGFRYPLPKLDSISIPGGFPGAMENWGAITYSERLLLAGPSATIADRQRVFDVQAHEMAHQWTGDLVTLDWWSDIWLNESFAAWMETKETALRNPTWAWWEAHDADKEHAMDADSQRTSLAIEQPVKNELEAEASFNPAIVYDKGSAVLRMLESYLGPNTFRDGLRRYIHARAYSNASGDDVWKALSAASGQDVAALAARWITQPGYPLVTVNATCDSAGDRTVTLSQTRFLMQGTDPSHERWSVPLQIRSGNGPPVQRIVLTQDRTIDAGRCDEPLIANADGAGFYRVAYDPQTLATNSAAFTSLGDADKIAMLDDQWAFARAGIARLEPYLALASQMGSDLDTRAWEQILASLSTLERDERGLPGHAAFEQQARALARPLGDVLLRSTKPDEAPPISELRANTLLALGRWGDPAVLAEARRRFADFERNRSALSPDDQNIILPIVAQYADATTFAQLHAIARSAKTIPEIQRYYAALVEVQDPKLAAASLQALVSDPLPPQAQTLKLRLVFAAAEMNPKVSWEFLQAHTNQLMGSFSRLDRALFLAERLPDVYNDAAPLSEIEAWLRAQSPPGAEPYIRRGIAAARVELAEKSRLRSELEKAARTASGTAARR